jgi:alkaline phosphatase D
MGKGFNRRDFLKTIVVTAGAVKIAPLIAGCGSSGGGGTPDARPPDAPPPDAPPPTFSFPQSVASGDPRTNSIVLWTRVDTTASGDVTLTLEVATDDQFANLVTLTPSEVSATVAADRCVRVKVIGLTAGTRYFYRFRAPTGTSRTGRFKTAAAATVDAPVRFAFLSCQDYIGRYYNPLVELLDPAQDDLDFVAHLGDYVYETTGDPLFQQTSGRHLTFTDQAGAEQLGTSPNFFYAAKSLSNYRELYKTYRSDATLQAVHEKFPFIVIWDDHEFVDDCWQDAINYSDGVKDEHDPERRRNSEQAFFEFQPVALDVETGTGELSLGRNQLFPNTKLYRDFRFGKHLELFMTDYRSFRPDHPIPEDGFPGKVVLDTAQTSGTDGFASVDPTLLAPYVDIDDMAYAAHKTALTAVLQAGYTAGGATAPRVTTLVAAALQGNVDANVVNALLKDVAGAPAAIVTDALPRGISLASMGKSGLFGLLGSRYVVVKQTYELYANFRQAQTPGGDNPYGAAQAAWLSDKLTTVTDATWTVLANSTALTSLIVDLTTFGGVPGVLPATQLYLNVDQWDGFPTIRKALFDQLYAKNAVIISGDIHAAYITDYGADVNANRVVELTGPGVSSAPFEELLRSTADSIPGLHGSPLIATLLSLLDNTLLPAGFVNPTTHLPKLKYSNSTVNGVVVVNVSGTQLEGKFALLDGPEALIDMTSSTVDFTRKTIVVPKVDGKNGNPTVT